MSKLEKTLAAAKKSARHWSSVAAVKTRPMLEAISRLETKRTKYSKVCFPASLRVAADASAYVNVAGDVRGDKNHERAPVPRFAEVEAGIDLNILAALLEGLILRAANVVFATTNSAEIERLIDERGQFDWSIVEEAGKATGSELISPLLLSHRRLMIGDHKQVAALPVLKTGRRLQEGSHRRFVTLLRSQAS